MLLRLPFLVQLDYLPPLILAPTYLLAERHFSLSNMAVGSSLPFLSIVVGGNVFATMNDKYSQRHDRTRVRKLSLISLIMAAVALLLIPLATHPVMIVFLLCLAAGLASGAYPVIASGSLDMTPRYAGTVVGFQNMRRQLSQEFWCRLSPDMS